jgi:hypothetical protein
MNIINFKFFEGITLLKYVTIFNENNAQIIILEFRAR